MKYMILFVSLVALPAFAAPVEFLGISIGDKFDVHDAAVRAAAGVGQPAVVTLVNENYTYYQCDSMSPKEGYNEFTVDVSTNMVVLCVSASLKCKDSGESKQQAAKIEKELREKYSGRIAPDGCYELSVGTGDTFVEVYVQGVEFKNIVERNNAPKGK